MRKKNILYFLVCFLFSSNSFCQIVMPTSGTATMSLCNDVFYGPGNVGSYLSSDGTLTICPSSPGTYMSVNFISFQTYYEINFLFIYDGANTSAPLLTSLSGPINNLTVTATASNPTGCLTFKFMGLFYDPGWYATFSCSPTPGISPIYDNRDCYQSTQLCSNATFGGNNTAAGVSELFNSWIPCSFSGEIQSSWYYFRTSTGGTLGFTLNPDPSVDYDFAIWGPYSSLLCPVNTFDTPVRCSFSGDLGDTGLGNGATDVSEDGYGDKWVAELPVNPNEVYILYINNFTANSSPYNLTWNLSGGASIDCTPLPVSLSYFEGKKIPQANLLRWQTLSEDYTDYFELQRSENGKDFTDIKKIKAAGQSKVAVNYEYTDQQILPGATYYYRLKQVDVDGHYSFSDVIFINNNGGANTINLFPNPAEDLTNVIMNSLYDTDANIEVIDVTGRIILEKKIAVSKGLNQFSLETSELPKGIYVLKLSSSSGLLDIRERLIK